MQSVVFKNYIPNDLPTIFVSGFEIKVCQELFREIFLNCLI